MNNNNNLIQNIDPNIEIKINKNNYKLSLIQNKINFYDNFSNLIMEIVIDNTDNIEKFIKSQNNFYLLITIILGCKRFGDWYAQELAKQNYLFVKTDDFWANIYGLLTGTPTIFSFDYNYYLFNYMPNKNIINDFESGKSNFIIPTYRYLDNNEKNIIPEVKLEKKLFIYDDSEIINSKKYKDTHFFENYKIPLIEEEKGLINHQPNKLNPSFNRYYFNKYIKYKQKYLNLKKILLTNNLKF